MNTQRNERRRSLLAGCVLAVAMLTAVPSWAQGDSHISTITIPAQALDAALTELAQKTGSNVLFSPEAVRGLRSKPIDAATTPEKAARQLVAGTELDVRSDETGAIIVRKRPRGVQPISTRPVLAAASLAEAAAPSAAPTESTVGEVIVTAERRSERLRDVPISVTALNEQTLEQAGVSTTHDLARLTPTLLLPVNGAFTQLAIRGISSTGSGGTDASNVAVYVDGVYQPFQPGQLMDLPDVRQIEVLKGPQGTLYGQNAAGGAIIISTIAPRFTPGGKLSASYGNYDDVALRGYVTGPLNDKVAASLAAAFQDRDGFRRDIVRGEGHDRGVTAKLVRGKLLFKPSDAVSLTAIGYYSDRRDSAAYSGQPAPGVPGTPLGYRLAEAAGLDIPIPTSPKEYATNFDPYVKIRTWGLSLLGEFDVGLGTISTVTAYSDSRVENLSDLDFTATNSAKVFFVTPHHDFIQEVNFLSRKIGRFSFAGGVFYKSEQARMDPLFFYSYASAPGAITAYPSDPAPVAAFGNLTTTNRKTYAGWAEAKVDLTDALTLSLSGRYTSEKISTSASIPPAPEVDDPRGGFTFNKFTPRATLLYRINETSNLYASYAQGFKSGYVDARDIVTPPVRPENVTAYEIGYKALLGERVSISVAAFHYNYKNLQVSIYVPPAVVFQNAASARIKGLDVDLTVAVTPDLTITAAGALLDAKYRKFPAASAYAPNALGFGYDSVSVDVGGRRMQRAPRFSGNIAANYGVDTASGRFGAYASVAYSSAINYDPEGLLRQRAYATLNGELSFEPARFEGLRVVLWGRNLTNKAYISGILETNFALGVGYAPPRTFGVRAEYKF